MLVNKQSLQATKVGRGEVPCVAAAVQSGSGMGEGVTEGPNTGGPVQSLPKEPFDPIIYLFSHHGRRLDVCFLLTLDQRDPCLPYTGIGRGGRNTILQTRG